MNDHLPTEPRPTQFTLRSLFVVTALVALLLSLTFPAIQAARESARRQRCAMNLKQIGLALHNYHNVNFSFPAALWQKAVGQPHHSWRVAISPFIEASPFYARYSFDQPWNNPGNLNQGQGLSCVYRCPSAPSAAGMTDYLAITGAATAWPAPATRRLQDFPQEGSDSILVVEHVNSGIHWLEPRDLPFDQLDFTTPGRLPPALASEHRDGTHVLFVDGQVKFLTLDTSPDLLKDMLLVTDKGKAEASPRGPEALQHGRSEQQ